MSVANAPVPTQGLSAGNKAADPTVQYDGVIFASAARVVGAYTSGEYFAAKWQGVRIFVNVTNANGGSLAVKVQNFDQASQTWGDAPLAVITCTTNALSTLTIHPGLTENVTANGSVDVSDPIGRRWRVVATVSTATMTFSVGGEHLV